MTAFMWAGTGLTALWLAASIAAAHVNGLLAHPFVDLDDLVIV